MCLGVGLVYSHVVALLVIHVALGRGLHPELERHLVVVGVVAVRLHERKGGAAEVVPARYEGVWFVR